MSKKNWASSLLLTLLAVIFSIGLTFASIELPDLLQGVLIERVPALEGDGHADDSALFRTELFMDHYHLRVIGYVCFGLMVLLIIGGFITGTPFQKSVWLEARKIPCGATETYKSLAQRLNHRGYRSIGQALSKNPLLIVIPCHRVLSSDGGFSAGLELKKYLLDLERIKGDIHPC